MQLHSARRIFAALVVSIFWITTPALAFEYGKTSNKKMGCPVGNSLDGLHKLKIFPDSSSARKVNETYPVFPDLVYEYRIAEIDNLSPIDFDFNPLVKRYIDIYTVERREQVAQMLGLANLYFPMFEEMLDKYSLPLELKYLAVVESALNPLAISPTGAVGLWQFKINTSRMFDLEVNSYVDERMDPIKSTEAACVYLQYLYRIFNNWHLALAAYNVGPGAVKAAIQRADGETNFWKLYPSLPEAAQNYVPAFIAAAYVFQNASAHGISKSEPVIHFSQTDTISIKQPIHISVLSQFIGVPVEQLHFLNPMYRQGFVPKPKLPAPIRIPSVKVSAFIKNELAIYEGTPRKMTNDSQINSTGSTHKKSRFTHTVKKGEYLHKIAIMYGCTIDDLQVWNPTLTHELSAGQQIEIWADPKMVGKLKQLGIQP